jgi:ribulose-5-phosphate 4-epimerase/fuculose-1-phosphate aldolase
MTTPRETNLRREIVEVGRRMYDRFFVAANDGNISARLDDESVLMTPTGVSKGFMSPEDILKVRLGGLDEKTIRHMVRRVVYRTAGRLQGSQPETARYLVTEADVRAVPLGGQLSLPQGALVTPLARQVALERQVTLKKAETAPTPSQEALAAGERRRPSSEAPMHLAIYHARADVRAVVHSHAPATTAFATTGVRLDEPLLAEVLAFIGPVALVPYARFGTLDLPQAMAPYLANHDAFLLANHGAVTVGRTLEEAYFRTERLELFARIRLAAQALGSTRPLPPEEVAQWIAMWERQRKET